MMTQDQFLEVIDRDEAHRRFRWAIHAAPQEAVEVPLDEALGRVLAEDVAATVDVPSFDRSNYDGYAVRAADTYGAQEEQPRALRLLDEVLATGVVPTGEVVSGTAMTIATGGMLPRGADAIVMVEHTESEGERLLIRRAVAPGFGVAFTGSDIARGETVLRRGQVLGSRATGVLAAIGIDRVRVWRRPRVAILSTGDEIVEPGTPMRPGLVYDSNARILADAVRELHAEPVMLGIAHDSLEGLRARLREGLARADVVLISGGTSKGAGDVSYRAVRELTQPGIVAHGVALKPGKPICLAAEQGKPVVILPGFPTSAIFTFHEFVAPVIRLLGGRAPDERKKTHARMAVKVNSEIGRTEFLLVGLVHDDVGLAAYPMTGGSGSVTTFSRADGFVTIGRQEEIVEAGTTVDVTLLSAEREVADLIVIGSHCVGLDYLLGRIAGQGFAVKFMAVGSSAGLNAVKSGQCDLAGMHLLDRESGLYNTPFLTDGLECIEGYGRMQGVVFRPGDARFEGRDAGEAIRAARDAADCRMINRNQGSGTRILIDRLLDGHEPPGYPVQAKSHNAVAAAVAQGRADWTVAIEGVAKASGLGFLPIEEERYDFVVPSNRINRPAVAAFRQLLEEPSAGAQLAEFGFRVDRSAAP